MLYNRRTFKMYILKIFGMEPLLIEVIVCIHDGGHEVKFIYIFHLDIVLFTFFLYSIEKIRVVERNYCTTTASMYITMCVFAGDNDVFVFLRVQRKDIVFVLQ